LSPSLFYTHSTPTEKTHSPNPASISDDMVTNMGVEKHYMVKESLKPITNIILNTETLKTSS
jgi:hypothetical protein